MQHYQSLSLKATENFEVFKRCFENSSECYRLR